MKKIPMRTCVVTREKCEKRDLIRVVRTPEGSVIIDEIGKSNGRGAYLKKDVNVINKAKQSNILGKQLAIDIPDSIYNDLTQLVNNK